MHMLLATEYITGILRQWNATKEHPIPDYLLTIAAVQNGYTNQVVDRAIETLIRDGDIKHKTITYQGAMSDHRETGYWI